jgi:two-component system chemotaxis response regulator CheB
VLVAPHSVHLLVSAEKTVSLDDAPPLEGHLPSATLLLSSVARAFGHHAVGVVLTGMGRDGVDGLRAIREVGGVTVAQDESSCVVYGMPRVAVELGAAQWCLPPAQIAEALCGFVSPSRRSRSGP